MKVNIRKSEFEFKLINEFKNPHHKGFRGVVIQDGVCGIGKTTEIFRYLNNVVLKANPQNRVFYVGQYLTELNRVQGLFNDEFHQPEPTHGKNGLVSKLNGLKKLIKNNHNVAISHKLFETLDIECITLLKSYRYHLVVDEEPNVVQTLKDRYKYTFNKGKTKQLSQHDISELIRAGIFTLTNSTLNVTDFNLHRYSDFYQDVRAEKIKLYTRGKNKTKEEVFIWSQNTEVFTSFETVHILTYLFKGSFLQGYFDIHKIPYIVEDLTAANFFENDGSFPFHTLVKLNSPIPDDKFPDLNSIPLSSTWFENYKVHLKSNPQLQNVLATRILSFFKQVGVRKEDKLWTTLKAYRKFLSNNGYKDAFTPFNKRATNEYRTKNHLVFAVNVYPTPIILNYFLTHKCKVSQDSYAISLLIQWVFRSRLREGLPIKLFIPSTRMYNLFNEWTVNYQEQYDDAKTFFQDFDTLKNTSQSLEPQYFQLKEYIKKQPGVAHIPWLVKFAQSF